MFKLLVTPSVASSLWWEWQVLLETAYPIVTLLCVTILDTAYTSDTHARPLYYGVHWTSTLFLLGLKSWRSMAKEVSSMVSSSVDDRVCPILMENWLGKHDMLALPNRNKLLHVGGIQ
jgi:hypothetical protein